MIEIFDRNSCGKISYYGTLPVSSLIDEIFLVKRVEGTIMLAFFL